MPKLTDWLDKKLLDGKVFVGFPGLDDDDMGLSLREDILISIYDESRDHNALLRLSGATAAALAEKITQTLLKHPNNKDAAE